MSLSFCTACTLPQNHCICCQAPELNLPINGHILFHPRELERRNSTGRLMKHCLHVPSSSWHRLKNQQQANLFKGYHLLYPCDNTDNTNNQTDDLTPKTLTSTLDQTAESTKHGIKGLLLLDATWQESQKMMRQNPWLMQLPKFSLATIESQYRLRRNQSESGLCTLESLAHALQALNHRQSSQDLLQFFHIFQSAYLEARQSGQLNPRTS